MSYPNLHGNTAVDVGSAIKSLTEQLILPAQITAQTTSDRELGRRSLWTQNEVTHIYCVHSLNFLRLKSWPDECYSIHGNSYTLLLPFHFKTAVKAPEKTDVSNHHTKLHVFLEQSVNDITHSGIYIISDAVKRNDTHKCLNIFLSQFFMS